MAWGNVEGGENRGGGGGDESGGESGGAPGGGADRRRPEVDGEGGGAAALTIALGAGGGGRFDKDSGISNSIVAPPLSPGSLDATCVDEDRPSGARKGKPAGSRSAVGARLLPSENVPRAGRWASDGGAIETTTRPGSWG